MVERKGFQKLDTYAGAPGQFETWSYKYRGFLCTEPGYRPLLEWIEAIATQEENEAGQRPLTLMGERVADAGTDPWLPGQEGMHYTDKIPDHLGKLILAPGSKPIQYWSEIERTCTKPCK